MLQGYLWPQWRNIKHIKQDKKWPWLPSGEHTSVYNSLIDSWDSTFWYYCARDTSEKKKKAQLWVTDDINDGAYCNEMSVCPLVNK